MFTINSIAWPKNAHAAMCLYLECIVKVFGVLNIVFPKGDNDPIKIATDFLQGEVQQDDLSSAASEWWAIIDGSSSIRNFQNQEILEARLALCILSVREDKVDQLGDNLSWFLEVLGFLGKDVDKAIEVMESHFQR